MQKYIVLFLMVINIAAFAQRQVSNSVTTKIYPYGFIKTGLFWAAGGADLQQNHGVINPASLRQTHNTLSLQMFGGQFNDVDKYVELENQCAISSLNATMPIKQFVAAIGFEKLYLYKQIMNFQVTTIADPSERNMISAHKRLDADLYYTSLSHPVGDFIKVGLTAGLSRMVETSSIYHSKAEGTGYGYAVIVGVNCHPIKNLHVDGVLRYFSNIEYDFNWSDKQSTISAPADVAGNNESIQPILDEELKSTTHLPLEVAAGASYLIQNRLTLAAKIIFRQWQTESRAKIGVVDYHLGAKLDLHKCIAVHLGFFSQKDNISQEISPLFHNQDQLFVTCGLDVRVFRFLNASVTYLDSNMLQADENKLTQRMGSVGVTFVF